jgi:hypothetical protein
MWPGMTWDISWSGPKLLTLTLFGTICYCTISYSLCLHFSFVLGHWKGRTISRYDMHSCRRYIDDDDIWTQRILLARWKTVMWQDPEASNSNQQQFGRRKLQSRTVKGGYSRSHSTIHTQSSSFPFVLAAGVFGFTFFSMFWWGNEWEKPNIPSNASLFYRF